MEVKKNKVVTLKYVLKNDAKEVLDSSDENGDLAYLHGSHMMLEGVEKALKGKKVGDKVFVALKAKDAYGEREEDLEITLPRSEFPEGEIETGIAFEIQMDDGSLQIFTVLSVEDDVVYLDGNHPLAGVNLEFDIEICDIREATKEEIEHGHPHCNDHGCGSCSH